MMHATPCTCRRFAAAATILVSVFAATAHGSEIGKVALLNGSQENPPVSTEAAGCARIVINTEDNTLSYYIAFGGLTTPATAAHIHGAADPGINAGVVHPLPAGNPKVGVWNYPENLEADILNGRMYINIHTSSFPGGELRGQIVDLVATIDNVQEVPDSGSAGRGFGLFNIDTIRNELDYYILYTSLGSNETGAHIHGFALHTVNAGVRHPLPLGTLKVGTWAYDESDEKRILDGETYVNIHSVNFPGGEIRGQIVRTVVPLDGTQENPPVDSTGHGCGLVSRDDDEDILSYHLVHANLNAAVTAAHIHGFAPPGINAGVLHSVGPATPALGQWDYLSDDEESILDGLTYFNVHSTAHPGGEVRGQIIFLARPCPIDLDCSGAVDFADILIILAEWGNKGVPADLDGSGTVDFGDILIVLAAWGACPA